MESNQLNYNTVAEKIILEQEQVIGPLARNLAQQVRGLHMSNSHIEIDGDPKTILEELVTQYSGLFGKASIAVSKHALKGLTLNTIELPAILA